MSLLEGRTSVAAVAGVCKALGLAARRNIQVVSASSDPQALQCCRSAFGTGDYQRWRGPRRCGSTRFAGEQQGCNDPLAFFEQAAGDIRETVKGFIRIFGCEGKS